MRSKSQTETEDRETEDRETYDRETYGLPYLKKNWTRDSCAWSGNLSDQTHKLIFGGFFFVCFVFWVGGRFGALVYLLSLSHGKNSFDDLLRANLGDLPPRAPPTTTTTSTTATTTTTEGSAPKKRKKSRWSDAPAII